MESPIQIAIVGLGRSGWAIHAKQLQKRQDYKIVDVVDPDPKRLAEASQAFACGAYPNLESLLKHSKTDLVVIATPSIVHEGDAIAVLKSGRHCLVEKPMAMSFAGAQRMIAAARKSKRKLFVHHNYRFIHPDYPFGKEFRHLREIIDSGILGRVFEIRHCWFSFSRRNDWQTLRKNGGGLLNNSCPHSIDVILNLLDAPVVSLLGDLQHIKDAGDCEDHVHVLLKAKNGRVADMTVSTAAALPSPKWMLLGSCGTASSDGKTTTLRYYDPKAVPELQVIDGPAPDRKYGNGDVLPWKEETRPTEPLKSYGDFYDHVADVLLRGAKMEIPPEDAAEVIRISEWTREKTKFSVVKK